MITKTYDHKSKISLMDQTCLFFFESNLGDNATVEKQRQLPTKSIVNVRQGSTDPSVTRFSFIFIIIKL